MAESFSVWQLACIVGLIWAAFLAVYLLSFLWSSNTQDNIPNTVLPVGEPKSASPKKRSKKPKSENKGKKETKPKNLHKIVPLGKVAYCKYCEVYMEDDEFLSSHESGKKHQKNCRGYDLKWYNIVEKPVEEEKKVVQQVEELEEGWTL